jgi:hypothetical protein
MSLRQFCVTLGVAFGAAAVIFAEITEDASARTTFAAALGAVAVVLLIGAGLSGPRPGP